MSHSQRRVVLTGIGVICPLGLDARSFALALQAGQSGVRAIRSFDTSALPVRIGSEIDNFDPRDYLEKKDRKQLKMMVRTIQLAVAAARRAVDDSRLVPTGIDPARFGVCIGTGTIPGELADLGPAGQASLDGQTGKIDMRRWGRDGLPIIPPMWMLNHVPNMPACHVSILHNAQGPNNTITQSDAASLLALGEAVRIVRRGTAEVMLAGGADTRIESDLFHPPLSFRSAVTPQRRAGKSLPAVRPPARRAGARRGRQRPGRGGTRACPIRRGAPPLRRSARVRQCI